MREGAQRSSRRAGILRCPICGAPVPYRPGEPLPKAFPFCSVRCKLVDLDNWLNERYVIGRELSAEEQEESSLAPPETATEELLAHVDESQLEALSREELLELLRGLKGRASRVHDG
ncbi:MAG: hypothetical protein KatS3mg115_2032 [Candidatus Poribacteria bacterium]|nr:MAG: hypothetical protein KatS3mg115_2032 [Candidatus Poribacteria bacterium]